MPSLLYFSGGDPGYLLGQDNHHHIVQLEELEEKLQKAASETGTQECPSRSLLQNLDDSSLQIGPDKMLCLKSLRYWVSCKSARVMMVDTTSEDLHHRVAVFRVARSTTVNSSCDATIFLSQTFVLLFVSQRSWRTSVLACKSN